MQPYNPEISVIQYRLRPEHSGLMEVYCTTNTILKYINGRQLQTRVK